MMGDFLFVRSPLGWDTEGWLRVVVEKGQVREQCVWCPRRACRQTRLMRWREVGWRVSQPQPAMATLGGELPGVVDTSPSGLRRWCYHGNRMGMDVCSKEADGF